MQTYTDADFTDGTIRSSKLKTLDGCSFAFYCAYILGIAQNKNSGSEKGDISHDILEMLGSPKNKHVYDKIINSESIYGYKPLERLVKTYIKNTQALKPDEETLKHLSDMILVGIRTDFWAEGGRIIAHEYKFEITNEKPYYKIKGFMDKVAIVGDYVVIFDYKSSKQQFSGEDREANLQAMLYSLAVRKLWPDKKCKVKFIFLAHPDNPIMDVEFNDDVLNGFQDYLGEIQKKFDNFTYKDAVSGFAYGQGKPSDGSFKGDLLCGYGKYAGHIKPSTGLPYWVCSYKWPHDYYVVQKDGKTLYTFLEWRLKTIKLNDGEVIVKMKHAGCPKHIKHDPLRDFGK